MTNRMLVFGGTRSGKSAFAEARLRGIDNVDYVATSQMNVDDPEWEARVAAHRERRPSSWQTIETLDIATELRRTSPRPMVVDCLTVWLTRQMDAAQIWTNAPGGDERLAAATDDLIEALTATARDVILVSNEVGMGVVPADPGTRRFRDEMGRLNIRVAETVDHVWFTVAGIPLRLK